MANDYSKLSEKAWKKLEPKMLPPRNTHVQLFVMEEVHRVLDSIKFKHWLVDGALICLYRDKELKDHNQDIDYACYSEEITIVCDEIKKGLLNLNYDVRTSKRNTRIDCYKYEEMVSIQGYELKKKYPKYRWFKKNRIPKRYFEAEQILEYNGLKYCCPNIEKYLSWKYKNWEKEYTGDTKKKDKYLNKRKLRGI